MDRVRIAVYSDVPRLATLAIARCAHLHHFKSERSSHTNHPGDTYRSCAHMFASLITDPQYIVLVVLNTYDQQEWSKAAAYLAPHRHDELFKGLDSVGILGIVGDQVIVGVVVWKLPPGSPRIGQFSSIPPPSNAPVRFDGSQDPDGNSQTAAGRILRHACDNFKKMFVPPPRTHQYQYNC